MHYFLFESSLGFGLFKVNQWDKIATTTPKLLKDFDSFEAFKKIASLEASHLFQGHNVAYEVLNKINEGSLPDDLTDFLKSNLPSAKKADFQLVVQDKNLATKVNEALKIKCVSGEAYLDIFRSIRKHLAQFLTGEAGFLTRPHHRRPDLDHQPRYRPLLRQTQHQVRREAPGQSHHQLVLPPRHHGEKSEHLLHATQGELRLALPRAVQAGL